MELEAIENELIDQIVKLRADRRRLDASVGYTEYNHIKETIEWRKALIRELIQKAGLTPERMN
ncbi:hypothetical protein GGR34_000758 [Microvirga flocculans]|uniref:Uncharacterized protein n=1 Tax=Microvirga flocculans TaxID=217168 RepID=A0A7W6N7B0_9HYPH|nr:hypothetical protein [Microvirga flocculans]MBB4039123.1 hypothetical protein [Microvirga flocculans]